MMIGRSRCVFWLSVFGLWMATLGYSEFVIADQPNIADYNANDESADSSVPIGRTAVDASGYLMGCGACNECRECESDCTLRGWVDGGILGNTSSPASHFNGPYNAVQRDDGQLNQLYLIMERGLPTDGSFGIGGRMDVLYGSKSFVRNGALYSSIYAAVY